MISTRGRYALRAMVSLAKAEKGKYTPLKALAAEQGISQKYLESIMVTLSKSKLLECAHGKGGGYRLCREASEYSAGEILRITEGTLAPVSCLSGDEIDCERSESCPTLEMWKQLNSVICGFLDSYTLERIVKDSE